MSFTFKQFIIEQDQCAMKVGTDGVLLGAWAKGGKKILDIGTGTGLIALMMAQRFSHSTIYAIEIDPTASSQAKSNFISSPFASRLFLKNISLQKYVNLENVFNFDAIVSNPPYFENSIKSKSLARTQARHTDYLPFRDLFRCAYTLLTDIGHFSIIVPFDKKSTIEAEAIVCGFFISKIVYIKSKKIKRTKRLLIDFVKYPISLESSTEFIYQDNGIDKSNWFTNLTKYFYLK